MDVDECVLDHASTVPGPSGVSYDRPVPSNPFQRPQREQDRRQRFFEDARRYTRHVSVEVEGLTFFVSTSDQAPGGRFFRSQKSSDLLVLRRACERLDPRGVFVDVGANIGTTTLPSLRYFERALAVEAEPGNAALLRANVALNRMDDRVTICEVACSSEGGEVELRLSADKHGGHAVRPAKPGSEMLTVPAVTLDELLAAHGVAVNLVGLLWMDLGGHEAHVLQGAGTVLDASVPLVVEIRSRTAEDVRGLLANRYSRVEDLRTETELPLEELSTYLEGVAAGGGRTFTDFLIR
jgi:FkbM family methyltransferase